MTDERFHPRHLVFLGTPDDAVPTLRALVAADFRVDLVVTAPDRRRGRRGHVTPSPVKVAAERLELPVAHEIDAVLEVDPRPQLGVVVAFGHIIRPMVLDRIPMVNLHFSLLPRWRGAAPVERAILAGDAETGVAVMDVEEGLDTGGVHAEVRVPIGDRTAGDLRRELAERGADLMVDTLRSGLSEPTPQSGEVTYAHKLHADDRRLDFGRSAADLARLVRIGGAWTSFRGERFKVHEAQPVSRAGRPGVLDGSMVGTADGSLRLETVQAAGKPRLPASEWLRGARPEPDERLG